MLGALGASLALGGNILGPIIFFVAWNLIRWAFMWYTQEFGYKAGSKNKRAAKPGIKEFKLSCKVVTFSGVKDRPLPFLYSLISNRGKYKWCNQLILKSI